MDGPEFDAVVQAISDLWWWPLNVAMIGGGLLSLYATIALWRLRRTGRTLFLWLTLVWWVVPWWMFVSLPPVPLSLVDLQLGGLETLLHGAILTMAFTEPIRSEFETR